MISCLLENGVLGIVVLRPVDLSKVIAKRRRLYHQLPKFPFVSRDMSKVVEKVARLD